MTRALLLWGGLGTALLVLSVLAGLAIGSVHLPIRHVSGILLQHIPLIADQITPDWPQSSEQIVMKVRLPRVVLALLVGASIGLAGAAFQGVLRNPLADPYTLGVSSGSSVGAALLIYFGLQYSLIGQWSVPLAAFAAGMLSLWLVLLLARANGAMRVETLILSGVVMQAFFGSIVSFLVALSDQSVNQILFWLMGSLSMRGWSYSAVLAPYAFIGFILLILHARQLNLFALGERHAAHLGIAVERTKLTILVIATILTAGAVSMAGVIGFVGLVVPHLIRLSAGPDYRLLLPVSMLGGAVYLLWADIIARTILAPMEIPLGVVTAFLGAPFFAYLLHKHKKAQERR
jgi:iron complex transport system permease protein